MREMGFVDLAALLCVGKRALGFAHGLLRLPQCFFLFRQVLPGSCVEASFGLGATRAEVLLKILLPAVRVPLIGAVILALGRALGETMAVLMVSGGALNYLPDTIYSPITSMAAFIASQLDSALQDPSGMAVRSLAEIALVLLIIAVIVNVIARLLTSRIHIHRV